jgi:YfiH family protein
VAAAPGAWSLERHDAIRLIRCGVLDEAVGVAHAFSTRTDGDHADFDLGAHDDRTAAVVERRERLLAASGVLAQDLFLLEQVHEARLVDVATARATAPRADGALARRGDLCAPAVRTADCVPLLLADVEGRAVAAVHAGWRGTAAGIATEAVERFRGLGIDPATLRAALGPAIGVCCYEVGAEITAAVARASGVDPAEISAGAGSNRRLDLHAANRHQLRAAGLSSEAISSAPWCTACAAELFFSYRRDGAGGGRQVACIGWKPSPADVP